MKYDGWLFIDMADLGDEATSASPRDWLKLFPGCRIKGSRQKLDGDWGDVEYISIAHTPIGPTVLDRCPNLKWVLIRGHASHMVNLIECKRRDVGVSSVGAFTKNCADYILYHLEGCEQPFLFYGAGRIASAVRWKLPSTSYYVNSRTSEDSILLWMKVTKTVVASVPPPRSPRPPLFSSRFFRLCNRVRFISVCHEPLIDNIALMIAIKAGQVESAVLDSLPMVGRDELLTTGKVHWTRDTAWKTNFVQEEFVELIRRATCDVMGGNVRSLP